MHRYLFLLIPIGCSIGCDVINSLPFDLPSGLIDAGGSSDAGSAKLISFESEQDALAYFREEISARHRRGGRDMMFGLPAPMGGMQDMAPGFGPFEGQSVATAGDDAAQSAPGFSQTTTQEFGVDEADVVKTDGTFLYMLSGGRLRIVRLHPADQLASISEVELDGVGRELFLDGDLVVVLSEQYGGMLFDDVISMGTSDAIGDVVIVGGPGGFAPASRPQTIVTLVDVSDAESPQVRSRTRFDGSMASSRMIAGSLYVVIANFQRFFHDVMPMLGRPQLDVSAVDLETLLPDFERIDADGTRTAGDVLTWEDLYRPEDADGFGIVSVIGMVPRDGAAFDAVGVVAEPGLIYSSREALYLTDTNFDLFENSRRNTNIHKLAYQDGQAVPVATGRVPGRILNQYSMSEFGGFLRVAATVRPNGLSDGLFAVPHNDVYVLAQEGDALNVVGSVEGIAPRETIQSARFIGDRGYVVTFEQVDPLFTLDLSDPTDPRVVGELKVPGFSTFIVPMDQDHLLTVGQFIPDDAAFFRPWGVQLSIFDVSDFAAPVLADSVVLGEGSGAFSEALHNPKAFTYFAESGLVALPVSIFEPGPIFFEGPGFGFGFQEGDVRPGGMDAPMQGPMHGPDGMITDAPVDVADPPVVIADPPPGFVDPGSGAPLVRGGFDGLVVFRVSPDAGFSELTRISTRFDQAGFSSGSYTRGVFLADNVFAVTDIGIRGGAVDPTDDTRFELFLGPQFDVADLPPPWVGAGVAPSVDEPGR